MIQLTDLALLKGNRIHTGIQYLFLVKKVTNIILQLLKWKDFAKRKQAQWIMLAIFIFYSQNSQSIKVMGYEMYIVHPIVKKIQTRFKDLSVTIQLKSLVYFFPHTTVTYPSNRLTIVLWIKSNLAVMLDTAVGI